MSQPFGFTGEQQDPSGLDYLRARMYDPSDGRFVQRDSYAGSLDDPQSLNRYSYAHNNPTINTDPSGHSIPLAPCVIGGLIGIGGDLLFNRDDLSWGGVG